MKLYDLPIPLKDDVLTLVCYEYLGDGIARQVYSYGPNVTNTVIKIETSKSSFQNVCEWETWQAVKEQKTIARWFAPCLRISDLGRVLLQERTRPVTIQELRKELPRVPAFFTDLKTTNWGRLDRRIVCHDYGTALVTENGLTTRTKKAEWWEP